MLQKGVAGVARLQIAFKEYLSTRGSVRILYYIHAVRVLLVGFSQASIFSRTGILNWLESY